MVALCLAAVMAVASARPRFLAIPLEDVEFVRGPYPVPHHRVVRRAGESHFFSNLYPIFINNT